jgi:EAL domain-containing protein (putative c-di-GMP-specific phosphodiesterase class I)
MNLEVDKANATIASTVVSLAHSLDLKVVAEGVETKEQNHFLFDLACDYAQGYYISRQLSADDLYQYLLDGEMSDS